MSARCHDCDASVFWADSVNGKPMLMDSDPTPQWKFILKDHEGKNPVAEYAHPFVQTYQHRYACHFDTCPNRRTA